MDSTFVVSHVHLCIVNSTRQFFCTYLSASWLDLFISSYTPVTQLDIYTSCAQVPPMCTTDLTFVSVPLAPLLCVPDSRFVVVPLASTCFSHSTFLHYNSISCFLLVHLCINYGLDFCSRSSVRPIRPITFIIIRLGISRRLELPRHSFLYLSASRT